MSVPKYQAWHKLAKKIVVIDMLDFALDAYRARSLDGVRSGSGHLADIELRQFTGLVDRNGKDIFEGDILCATSGALYRVYFPVDALAWMAETRIGRVFLKEMNLSLYEIIGNIYENPTLLEASHATS